MAFEKSKINIDYTAETMHTFISHLTSAVVLIEHLTTISLLLSNI